MECYLQSLSTSPQRVSTLEKLIASYEQLGQTDQADNQRAKLVDVQKQIEEQRVKMQADIEQRERSLKPKEPTEEMTTTDDGSNGIVAPKELTPSVPSAL